MKRTLIQLLVLASWILGTYRHSAFCQSVTIGVKAGLQALPLLNEEAGFPDSDANDFMNRLIAGPTFEIGLPHGFAFGAEALRREFSTHQYAQVMSVTNGFFHSLDQSAAIHSWEFPIVIKMYTTELKAIRPYVEAGISERFTTGVTQFHSSLRNDSASPTVTVTGMETQRYAWNAGAVLGFGADLKAIGRLHFIPQFRYTRLANSAFTQNGFHSNRNAFDILVGVGLDLKQ